MTGEKNDAQMENFRLGRPALVCRWRLAARTLPLENRHLRALSRRVVNGAPVSPQLVAWAKQHIEWTLGAGAALHPDGVLMVIVDEEGRAAMTVGPYDPLPVTTVSALAERALGAAREADVTGVAPEGLWLVRGEELVRDGAPERPLSGAASLIADLARTAGIPVACEEGVARAVMDGTARYDEAFLVSDEHGVVPAAGASGPRARRLADGYARLLESARRAARPGASAVGA
ncbi:hypothetical protein [Olsenella uli]|uniref:hypothetical protein n=1 Tax=Olsenella uli TaxID=133926 RepID=UPI001EF62033|nr:hypothetical protein [Olsenella uli]